VADGELHSDRFNDPRAVLLLVHTAKQIL